QVHVHRRSGQSSRVGTDGARTINVYYNGRNHYEASLPPASEPTTEHFQEDQAANSSKTMKAVEDVRDSTPAEPSDVTRGASGHHDEPSSTLTPRVELTNTAHDEKLADAVDYPSDSVDAD